MTPQEAIEKIKTTICNEEPIEHHCHDNCMYGSEQCAFAIAIKALEKADTEESTKIKM